jgi:hypothetical protein
MESSLDVARQLLGLSNVIEPHGEVALRAAAALASGAAIAFARPALYTNEARAAFAPVAYRSAFLAGAMASVVAAGTSMDLAEFPLIFTPSSPWIPVLFALAASFLASAIGVVRMRAWGVLLGGATALVATLLALWSDSWAATAKVVALAATPGLLLGLPVLAARLRQSSTPPARSAIPARVAAPQNGAVGFDDSVPVERPADGTAETAEADDEPVASAVVRSRS